jgi:hypothetical protein
VLSPLSFFWCWPSGEGVARGVPSGESGVIEGVCEVLGRLRGPGWCLGH